MKFTGDNMDNGTGLLVSYSGNFYDGEFKNKKFHGSGMLATPTGFYSGDFNKGKITGKGTWLFSNGTIYDGTLRNNLQHGYGKRTYENGDCYEGEWEDGLFHGYGKYSYSNGGHFEGFFDKGVKSGFGQLILVKRSVKGTKTITYIGQWVNNKFHCNGGVVIRENTSLIASWEHNKIKGIATININNEVHTIDFDDKNIFDNENVKRILSFFEFKNIGL